MKKSYSVQIAVAAFGLLALSGELLAQDCTTSEDGTSIGTVGGSASCAAWGMSGCKIDSWSTDGTGSCQANGFTVNALLVNGNEVQWSAFPTNGEEFAAIDLSIWEGTRGGQNYPFIWPGDVNGDPEAVEMSCTISPKTLWFCSDGTYEPRGDQVNEGQPYVGASCADDIDGDGNPKTAEIFGVNIDVNNVDPGLGEVTIAVFASNRPCPIDPDNPEEQLCSTCTIGTDCVVGGDGKYYEPDPDFGCNNGGQLNVANNICIAQATGNSVQFVPQMQCDPSKEIINGAFIDSLPECGPRRESVVRQSCSVTLEGSGSVWTGGSPRYW